MKLKKLSFASITLTAALFFSYVIPETVFTNESIAQAAIVNQKQVTFEIKPYPGTELDKFYLDTINGYVLKPATIYDENGQKYVNINVLGVGTSVALK